MSETAIINVAQGALRGRKVTSQNGKSYLSFQGIPYAKPPVGRLRFKEPQPLEPWSGIRSALKEGNACPQMDMIRNVYIGEEDCLYLNVFTPQLPGSGVQREAKPVMVFIHGGGFTAGSGNSEMYGPDYIVEQGVLLVTINYRLGAFGFLSTEDAEIPGNAGMKDQVAALRWVQQNIARFGGDPGNVTIFGESAGAASVHFHVLSPMSKGLFHRAISQSGSALNIWAFCTGARTRTARLAQVLGCQSDASKDIVAFLRDVPAKDLVDNYMKGISDEEKRRGNMIPFVIVSENGIASREEKFLTSHPADIIKSGKFNKVPFILGVNTSEGLLMLKDIAQQPQLLDHVDKDFQAIVPSDLCPQLDTDEIKEVAQKIKKFYFGDKPVCEDTILQFAELNSDKLFVYNIVKSARLHAANSTSPVYCYQFAFEGKFGVFKKLIKIEHLPGVCHADELGYLFKPSVVPLEADPDSPEKRVQSIFVSMWTNFAKTGKPNTEVMWEPVTPSNTRYMRIDTNPEMLEDLEKDHVEFWDNLYSASKSNKTV